MNKPDEVPKFKVGDMIIENRLMPFQNTLRVLLIVGIKHYDQNHGEMWKPGDMVGFVDCVYKVKWPLFPASDILNNGSNYNGITFAEAHERFTKTTPEECQEIIQFHRLLND